MGYEILMFDCVACGTTDTANAELVPSIRAKWDSEGQMYPSPGGRREPLCRRCAARVNEIRAAAGKEPVFIHPDAYTPRETT